MEAYRECVVDAAALRGLMRELLVAVGCSAADAAQTTDALLEADLRGYAFEGCRHLPALLRDLRAGRVTAKARPRIVEERSASALVDGDGGPAPVGGSFAARVAVEKASQAGCCAVGLVNTDPLYMLGYFGEEIARAGLVAIIGSAGRPRVHPPGGVDPILGTNPLTIAVPTHGDAPLVVDFATSGVAFGAVQEAQRRGRRLPDGVAVGPGGRPTRDPAEAVAGALTAFGGYKGFGLALCVGLLAGPLVGGAVGRAMAGAPRPGRRTNRGTLLVAVDPAAFGDPGAFRNAVTAHLREVGQSARAPGVGAIRLPGERSRAERTRRLREGVPIEESVLDELEALARDLGIGAPRPSRRARPDTVAPRDADSPG